MAYLQGLGTERNYAEAFLCFQRAANLDYTSAYFQYGYALERGLGCEPNVELALQWYEKAAASGDPAANERMTRLLTNDCFGSSVDSPIPHGHAAAAA